MPQTIDSQIGKSEQRRITSYNVCYTKLLRSWLGVDARNEHYVSTGMATGLATDIRFRCISVQPGWDWWWTIDNFAIYFTDPVPVELTSFAASVNDLNVTLNWSTS